jgi:hypothetical protein
LNIFIIHKMSENPPEINSDTSQNIIKVINDFCNDLSITFPEYTYLWSKYTQSTISEKEMTDLVYHLINIYPERFFDIIYQNEDIFSPESTVNVYFLPDVNFRLLYNCENVSENTKKTIWNYLKLVLILIVNSVKDKNEFGDAMNMFDGVDENDLHEKLEETMNDISEFLSNAFQEGDEGEVGDEGQEDADGVDGDDADDADGMEDMEDGIKNIFKNIPKLGKSFKGMDFEKLREKMPKPEEIHEHLKTLFDGKIGKLAKELSEELSNDIAGILGEGDGNIKSTKDALQKLIKNPKIMMDLIKSVGSKIEKKVKSGEVSQEELIQEASEIFGKMKGMDDEDGFGDILKKVAKQMGGMGGLGGNTRFNTGALNNMMKKNSMKEKLRAKMEKKRQMVALNEMFMNNAAANANTETNDISETNHIEKKDNKYVFKMDGEEPQPKSVLPKKKPQPAEIDEIEMLARQLDMDNSISKNKVQQKKKKSGK